MFRKLAICIAVLAMCLVCTATALAAWHVDRVTHNRHVYKDCWVSKQNNSVWSQGHYTFWKSGNYYQCRLKVS